MTFKTLEEAIALANDCEYGLTSSIYTQNLTTTMTALRQLKFGETYVNRENFGSHAGDSMPAGASRASAVLMVAMELEEYLQTHVVYLQC
ncbi:aldehyde dehydrogenase family protein [Pantoea ananatis]